MRGNNFKWDETADGIRARMWAEGKSASMISAVLGVSRNAVIGRNNRRGATKRERTAHPNGAPRKPRVRKVSLIGAPHSKVRAVDVLHRLRFRAEAPGLAPGAEPEAAAEPPQGRASIAEVTGCRWPFGEGPPFRFCDAERMEGSSYCQRHWILSTRDQARAREILRWSGRAG